MLRSSEIHQSAKTTRGAKERVNGELGVHTASLFERRDDITMGWDDTVVLAPMIENTGVEMVRGFGKLIGVKKVQITPRQGDPVQLEARLAVALCTGSSPSIPDVPGLKEAKPWTPRDATSSNVVPEHLIIMGGGVVGAECATAYSSYGSKVTVISSSPEVLPRIDPEAGKIVREALESKGVKFCCSARIMRVERMEPNKVIATLSNGERLEGSELLVATGRKANIDEIGLEVVGVQVKGKTLPVDEHLRVQGVSGDWLYAPGDLNGRAMLTHTSKYHAVVAANAILADASGKDVKNDDYSVTCATADQYATPQVIFTDPVVASVGLTRTTAQSRGLKIREVNASMAAPGYNIHTDSPAQSWMQWLINGDDCLVGATFVGSDAAELLHASTVAIVGGIKLDRLMHAIPSFPTLSWAYYNLMDAAGL